MSGHFKNVLFIVLLISIIVPSAGHSARIKDISSIKGIRQNQLLGYGLIIGLNGTGDKSGTGFTIQGLVNMLEHMGVHVDPDEVKVKNVAAVVVSAKFPPFARVGKKIDVTLSSIGDAKSLQGGTLLLTPLKGVDGKVYAIFKSVGNQQPLRILVNFRIRHSEECPYFQASNANLSLITNSYFSFVVLTQLCRDLPTPQIW